MEIRIHTPPFDCQAVLALWGDIFGKAEAELERPQIDGSEAEWNEDVVFAAWEGDCLLGAVHTTAPRQTPGICGISGVCTSPAARGKGVGKALFAAAVDHMEKAGAEVMVLGTANPVAAKLYHSFGFAYQPGSNVMMRFRSGDWVDFERETYATPTQVRVVPADPSMRIPLVPLVLRRSGPMVLDCNTGLFNRSVLTQLSCMGLYPKYMDLADRGGNAFGLVDERGVLGGMASVELTPDGARADLFFADSFAYGFYG